MLYTQYMLWLISWYNPYKISNIIFDPYNCLQAIFIYF